MVHVVHTLELGRVRLVLDLLEELRHRYPVDIAQGWELLREEVEPARVMGLDEGDDVLVETGLVGDLSSGKLGLVAEMSEVL